MTRAAALATRCRYCLFSAAGEPRSAAVGQYALRHWPMEVDPGEVGRDVDTQQFEALHPLDLICVNIKNIKVKTLT